MKQQEIQHTEKPTPKYFVNPTEKFKRMRASMAQLEFKVNPYLKENPMVKNRSAALDACRAFAVLAVILHHLRAFDIMPVLMEPLSNWPTYGMFGVDLFYVLSGFFITQAILRPTSWSPSGFIRARVTRIYPAYLFSLAVVVIGGIVLGNRIVNQYLVTNVLLHISMLHNFLPGLGGSLNGVYWTLGVEFPYYILMLALAPFLRDGRKFWYISSAMLALCILWRMSAFLFLSPDPRFFAATQLPGSLDAFALGGMTAMLHLSQQLNRRLVQMRWPLFALGIVCMVFSLQTYMRHAGDYWLHGEYVVFWRTSLEFSFALIVLASAKMADSKWVVYSGLPWIGKISFSLYLYHLPAILFVKHFGGEQASAIKLLLSMGITLVVSWLSWRFIEKRFHKPSSMTV